MNAYRKIQVIASAVMTAGCGVGGVDFGADACRRTHVSLVRLAAAMCNAGTVTSE